MAFIRKRGNIYYLVHNRRDRGHVRQLYLARLGRRARINDEVIEEVMAKHPLVRVDWKRLREKASGERLQPLKDHVFGLRKALGAKRPQTDEDVRRMQALRKHFTAVTVNG